MKFYIVIAVHNEKAFIKDCLMSLANQTLLPKKIVLVDDNSTDETIEIVKKLAQKFSFIKVIRSKSSENHFPGKKVISAFNFGLKQLDDNYDVICKFDGDLIFPKQYLETISHHYKNDPKLGMISGHCYILNKNTWIYENIASKSHTRGPIKSYRKSCFKDIGGLKVSEGWDTVDELIALYHGWYFKTDASLKVKHLKPTGSNYKLNARYQQGMALYKMRSSFLITVFSATKMAYNKRQVNLLFFYLIGYFRAWKKGSKFIVTESQGKFIRTYRWRNIYKKIIKTLSF